MSELLDELRSRVPSHVRDAAARKATSPADEALELLDSLRSNMAGSVGYAQEWQPYQKQQEKETQVSDPTAGEDFSRASKQEHSHDAVSDVSLLGVSDEELDRLREERYAGLARARVHGFVETHTNLGDGWLVNIKLP